MGAKISVALFLIVRLPQERTLRGAARAASQPALRYQRVQFWIRRSQQQVEGFCASLTALTAVLTGRAVDLYLICTWGQCYSAARVVNIGCSFE